jgi:hypothetical protein
MAHTVFTLTFSSSPCVDAYADLAGWWFAAYISSVRRTTPHAVAPALLLFAIHPGLVSAIDAHDGPTWITVVGVPVLDTSSMVFDQVLRYALKKAHL